MAGRAPAATPPWRNFLIREQPVSSFLTNAAADNQHRMPSDNTTWALVADMEKLRRHLGINRWLVCGGSWGSALALAYAETHPQSVSALILRGIFTLRRAELLWFYQEGASWLFPDLWEDFIAPIPPVERGDIISAYYRRLTGDDEAEKLRCAKAWSVWEAKTLSMNPDDKRVEVFSDYKFALAFARIESHYFVNGGFFEHDGQLIANAEKLADIPGVIVQGRYDVVTPMKTAWDLHRAWPKARFITVGDAVTPPPSRVSLRPLPMPPKNFVREGNLYLPLGKYKVE